MKKIFFGMAALVAFVATSCQQTPDLAEVGVGGETATVSFNLGTPQIASRADFSDGTTASHLQWAVYDANGNILNDLKGEMTDFQISTTVEFQLTTGNTYYVLFWAAAPSAPYTVDLAAQTMTVNYTGAVSSDENRDAFYYYDDFTVQNGMDPVKAELRRPFAQLNIGTNDFEASEKAGHKVTHAMVEVPAYSTLNFANGEVSDKAVRKFAYAAVPGASQEFPVNDAEYDYIAMNYLLMASTKETVDVKFTYATDENGTAAKERTVGAVPVQRNHRTNLYGQLFTSNTKVNVEIKPEYEDDDKYGAINGEVYVKVANAEEFKAAFADENVDIIILTEDLVLSESLTRAADPTLAVSAGKKLTIDLNDKKISATSSATGKNYNMFDVYGTLTVKNGDLEYEHKGENMVWNNYAELFHVGGNGVLNLEGVTAKNLGGSNMAYVVDLTNASNITVNIENSTLESTYIPVRVFNNMENGVNNVTIENTTLKGKYCFWVQFYLGDGAKYTEETVAKQLNIDIFGNGNTFEYTGKSPVLYGDNNAIYFDAEGNRLALDQAALSAALAEGVKRVVLADGNYDLTGLNINGATLVGASKNVVVKPHSCTYNGVKNITEVAIENVTLNVPENNTYCGLQGSKESYKNCVINGQYWLYSKNTTFEECVFNTTDANNYNVWTYGAANVEFTKCTFNSAGKSVLIYKESLGGADYNVTFNECALNASAPVDGKAAIEIDSSFPNGGGGTYTVAINATTANGFANGSVSGNSLWNQKKGNNGNITVDGKVVAIASGAVVSGADDTERQAALNEALAEGAKEILLPAGNYTMPAASNFTAETVVTCEEGTVFTGTSGLNINGATIVGAEFKNESGYAVSGTINGTIKDCVFDSSEALRWCYTTEGTTTVFENCEVKTNFRGIHFDDMKGDIIFKNCKINGFNAFGGKGTVTFEGCTFDHDASSYNGLNLYANTVIKNSTFVFKSGKTDFVDLEAEGLTLTITNCTATLDGTATDIANFVGGSKKGGCTVIIE